MERTLQAGLVGYGMAGEVFHAPLLANTPGIHLKTIVDRSGSKAGKRYPAVNVVRETLELLADDEIELVVIATPNDSHFELASLALRSGKHVVVDKPLAVTAQEVRQLTALAEREQRVLSVFHNRRWDGGFLTAKRIAESGLLGKLVEYEARFERFDSEPHTYRWRESGQAGSGILYDLGSHLIDQALMLFGLPQTVRADIRIQRDGGLADDFFEIALGYEGLRVLLKAGMLVKEPGPHITMHGSKGSYVKHGLDPQERALQLGATPGVPGWGEEPPELWGTLHTELEQLQFRGKIATLPGSYLSYYENMYDVIVNGAELLVTAEQALHTMLVMKKALESNVSQATVPFRL